MELKDTVSDSRNEVEVSMDLMMSSDDDVRSALSLILSAINECFESGVCETENVDEITIELD